MREALVSGAKQGVAKKASKTLTAAIRKMLGKNYPAFFGTPIGTALEPFVIPVLVVAAIDHFAEWTSDDDGETMRLVDERLSKIYRAATLALTGAASDQAEMLLAMLDPQIEQLVAKLP